MRSADFVKCFGLNILAKSASAICIEVVCIKAIYIKVVCIEDRKLE